MTNIHDNPLLSTDDTTCPWRELAGRVLQGHRLSADEGLAMLRASDAELLDLLAAAYRVRYQFFGNRVHLNFLINAKSGNCSEDCGYCSQSNVSKAEIPRYNLVSADDILDGAREAAERRAKTYCTVISGRTPSEQDFKTVEQVVPEIKGRHPLKICFSCGLLTPEEAARLKAAGVDRINHNLNTSGRFYPSICTTHDHQQRVDTLRAVRDAGLEICSGGIVGMGEEDRDVVDLALQLGELAVEALPVNFYMPIAGTPVAKSGGGGRLNPCYCLKVLAMFRLANPQTELRIAAGREMHLGPMQPLGLYAANSIFVGDYLTTKGQPPADDYRMIEAMGFEAVVEG